MNRYAKSQEKVQDKVYSLEHFEEWRNKESPNNIQAEPSKEPESNIEQENHMAMRMPCLDREKKHAIVTMLETVANPYHVGAANIAKRLRSSGRSSQVKLITLFH